MKTFTKTNRSKLLSPISIMTWVLVTLMIFSSLISVAAETSEESKTTTMIFIIDNSTYVVNGEPIVMDVSPAIIENRTMLPIRYAAEPLGADIEWDGEERKATISLDEVKLELWIGESNALINGKAVPIDADNVNVKPLIVSNRTMLPLRFVTENLGCDIEWDPIARKATITKAGSTSDTDKTPDIKLPGIDPGDIKLPGVDLGDIKFPGETPDPDEDTGKIPDVKLPGIDPGDIKLPGQIPDIIKLPKDSEYEIFKINDTAYYENYFGTVLTADTGMLTASDATYQWGVTNSKDMSLQYFTFFLKPGGKYKYFRADFYLDSSAKADLVMNIRKETKDGMVLKSLTLKPGETLKDVITDITGVNKLCIESEIRINHGTVKKIVVGHPVFMNNKI